MALDVNELTWYEEMPQPSIKLLSKCHINKNESILDVGADAAATKATEGAMDTDVVW